MPPVWMGAGILAKTGEYLRNAVGAGPYLVVADVNTQGIAARVSGYLHGLPHKVYAFAGPAHAGEEAVNELSKHLESDTQCIVAVGSGSVTDVVRLTSFKAGLPFASVATAASMDGYLSWGAPIAVEGYKLTHPAQGPSVVVADLDIISAAPPELTRAGFGDVIGKFTALADWRIGHLFSNEYYCPALSASVYKTLAACENNAGLLGTDPGKAAGGVLDALFVTGHAMICVGNSRPAAGAEHYISHYWEMRALAAGCDHHYHGDQVAVGCVLSAAIYHELLSHPILVTNATEWQERRTYLANAEARQQRVAQGFGKAAARLLKVVPHTDAVRFGGMDYAEVNAWWQRCRQEVGNDVPSPERLIGMLRRAGAPAVPRDLGLSPEWVHDAIIYARELRPKFSILDVAAASGLLEQLANKVAAESSSW